MKPYIAVRPRAALTEEDSMIWLLVTYRFCRQNVVLKSPVVGFHRGVDDRDAELMLYLTGAKLPSGWGVYRHRGMPKAWWLIPRVEA